MTSIHLGIQPTLSSSPSKGSLQKVPLVKVSSHNSGTASPKHIERKTRGYQSSKTLILQQEKNGEDGTDSVKKGALKNGTLVLANASKDDFQPNSRKLELSEIFAKYTLTTDVPFMGSRTTKAKIEPVKPVEITPKAVFVMKPSEEQTPSTSKYAKLTKTTSRLLPPDTKSVTGSEAKPSLNNSIRKNRERDSQVTVEVDSKLESPSKSSFEIEADLKEKQAFLTEALMAVTPNMIQDQDSESIDLMQNTTNEDTHLNHSIHSDERRDERKNYGVREGIKRLQIQKQTYDPFSVLNQVRTKRRQQETTNRKIEQSKFETRMSARNNIMSDSSKLSTPRDFTVLRSRKVNLFEGIPYVPYDIFLRQDPNMQNVIVKDILKVLLDKAKSLQNFFRDNYRIDKIMKNIEEPEQGALNLHLEETIGLINAIGTIILQEFKDSVDKIGIKPSPIFDNPHLRVSGFVNEIERFYDNSNIFLETIEHLRDCVDCYYVMTRQRDRKPIADYDCSNLLQFIARSRYNLGQLFEAFRVIEKHVDGKLTWKAENKKKLAIESGNKPKGDNHKSLNDLLQQKFNINKNKMLTTRESKVVLNQEAEDEKFLKVVQNQKQLKKKGAHEIGDSRKLIILDRILNPLEDPEIQLAIKVAKEKTNVQISKDLLESIGSRTKSVDHKSKHKIELPFIKNTMQKMMSTKNLTTTEKGNEVLELPKLQKPKKITTKTR